ncbi:MAG: hypothetical protein DHS20C21_17680 [Gemmatimonadota bacterium]|nr:MAG: hypothetical protein DHS20C21_17680 [Gemmatimonadota bacterium]
MSEESEVPPTPKLPTREVMVLTELEQIKVLADPLRIRILEELCEERTTKQVAERLGEKPTKLYHHVEALDRVGLISLTRTKQNRGTLEKYYQAVARSFRADTRAFSALSETPDEEKDALRHVVETILSSTSAELMSLIESGQADRLEGEGLLTFVEIGVDEEHVRELRKRLEDIIAWLTSLADDDDDSIPEQRHRLTIAYYPIESREPAAPGDPA